MCSIIAIHSTKPIPSSEIIHYAQRLQHRGPDGIGITGETTQCFSRTYESAVVKNLSTTSPWWIANGLLSLTGKGSPPYTRATRKGNITLAHNGEIYNYRELSKKYSIPISKDSSDAELLCALIAKWSEKQTIAQIATRLQQEVRGSYALAIQFQEKTYAFRDALGKKPIWVAEEKNKIIFSSEPIHPRAFLLPPTQLATAQKGKLHLTPIIPHKKITSHSLAQEWKESMALRTNGKQRIAVSFSGGIDSALIAYTAKQLGKKVIGIGVGIKGSHDEIQARKAAKEIGITLKWKTLTTKTIHQLAKEVTHILQTQDQLQQRIGVVNAATAHYAHQLGFRFLLSGTGADELFCGYGEFERVRGEKKEINKLREKRMREMWKQNLWREDACAMRFGVELRTPYLDQSFAAAALAIPAWENLEGENGTLRKNALRRLAIAEGLPREIALQPKKAMQYGSGVAKVMEKNITSKHD